MKREIKLNPWGTNDIEDYPKLFEEFGVSPFKDLLAEVPNPHPYMRRGVIFGHRDYQSILDALHLNEPFGVMSGFMPSGPVHLGHKMVMDEIIWHQRMGAEAFFVAIGTVVRPPSIRNLKEDEVLTNDTRDRIYNYILNHEGAHFREIINYIDIGPFEGTWHLQVLEDFGFIVSRRYRHYKIFYPLVAGKEIPLKDPRLVLKSKTAKAIVRFILKNPGAYQNLIAKQLGKSSGAIRYNMKKLVDAKIINIMKENGLKRFYINEKNLALKRILPENAFSV